MSPDVIGYLVGGAVSVAAAWLTARSTRKSKEMTDRARVAIAAEEEKAEKRRADGEAYDRAQRINEEMVTALRNEVARLQAVLAEQRVVSAELEVKVQKLSRDLGRLTLLLERNNIPLPESMNGGF